MRVAPAVLALVVLGAVGTNVRAGWRERHAADKAAYAANPLVAPNGVVTPMWAAKRMENSPVPLYGNYWGRRPWAFPVAQQATASANMARWDQLGYGAGPIPGYTNGPPLGNYPTAAVGPTPPRSVQGPGYGPGFSPGSVYPRNVYGYPGNIYINGN